MTKVLSLSSERERGVESLQSLESASLRVPSYLAPLLGGNDLVCNLRCSDPEDERLFPSASRTRGSFLQPAVASGGRQGVKISSHSLVLPFWWEE